MSCGCSKYSRRYRSATGVICNTPPGEATVRPCTTLISSVNGAHSKDGSPSSSKPQARDDNVAAFYIARRSVVSQSLPPFIIQKTSLCGFPPQQIGDRVLWHHACPRSGRCVSRVLFQRARRRSSRCVDSDFSGLRGGEQNLWSAATRPCDRVRLLDSLLASWSTRSTNKEKRRFMLLASTAIRHLPRCCWSEARIPECQSKKQGTLLFMPLPFRLVVSVARPSRSWWRAEQTLIVSCSCLCREGLCF
jgi:hypothetical protein